MGDRIFRRLSYAVKFVFARERVIRGDFAGALEVVNGIYHDYRCSGPCREAPVTVNVIYALAAWNLSRQDLTFQGCYIAADQLSDKIKADNPIKVRRNSKYLMCYCKYLLQFAESEVDRSQTYDLTVLRAYQCTKIAVAKVDGLLRRSFPIDQEWLEGQWAIAEG
jgi:hypothetical protein